MIKFTVWSSRKKISQDILRDEIKALVSRAWGKFPDDYIDSSIFSADFICFATFHNRIIGVIPVKKVEVFGDYVYSIGLTVVDSEFRDNSLLKKMSFRLLVRLLLDQLSHGKLILELIFITPNIRTLGMLSRVSHFIYPNPYSADSNGRVNKADETTWRRVREYLKVTGEHFSVLEREACVMEGFYTDKEHLALKEKINHRDKILDSFGERYLYNRSGREIVVRSILNIKDLIFVEFNKLF